MLSAHFFLRLVIGACELATAGCIVTKPRESTAAELRVRQEAALVEAAPAEPTLLRPLTLEEAIARSLKYNLSQRALRVEQALAAGIWNASNYDLLPRVTAGSALQWRDRDLTSRSRDSVTGRPSLANPFISSDRASVSSNLGASWSVLEFAVGYYLSRQNADRTLIALEQRRRAMHALTRETDLRSAEEALRLLDPPAPFTGVLRWHERLEVGASLARQEGYATLASPELGRAVT